MRAKFLGSVSIVALLWTAPALAQQLDTQVEQQFAAQYSLNAGDLTAATIQLLKEKLAAEQKAGDAQNSIAAAQATIDSTARQLNDAKADQQKKYQAILDSGLKIVTGADGKVTTDAQAARESAMRQANDLTNQYKTAYNEALIEWQIATKNPSAYTPQQRAEIESRMNNASEHQRQAEQAAIHVAEQIDRQALTLLQDYNGALDKTKSATTANDQAKSALTSANNAATVSKATAQDVNVLLQARAIADSDAKKARDDVARTAAAAGKFPPVSVLGTVGGATNLNVINLADTLANGTIRVSDLTPEQKSAIVAQGGGNIVAQGAGNIRIADLTPAMLLGIVAQGGGNIVAQGAGNIVAQGGGNIVAQGGGNIVAQGAGNIVAQGAGNLAQLAAALGIVAQGAGNIVAQGAGNIVAQGAGNIVAQGAGNLGQIATAALANAKEAQTALLTAGLANSLITNDGASLIGRQVAQGLITNDGGSLITNDGGSLITNDGGSLAGKTAAQLAASAASLIDNAKVASFISTNGGGIVAQGAGNIVAQGAGNIVAQGAGNVLPSAGGIRAFQGTTEFAPTPPSPQVNTVAAPTAPISAPAGGGFKHDTTISVSGSYVDQKTGNIVSTNDKPIAVATAAPAAPAAPATATTVVPAAATRPYDANDWTTWPQKNVQEFMRPGTTVEQFKTSAEKDLASYKYSLAALSTHSTLTPTQQSQKAGLEAQIQSLEFQIDSANRALGLPSAASASNSASTSSGTAVVAAPAAPAVPVMSAAAIAATVPLKTTLAEAQTQVDNRLQQIASANQGLAELQAQRAKTTDPTALKGIDVAISSAKFQIDVMQQSLDRENKQIATLQAASQPAASANPAATPAAAIAAEPVKLSADQNTAIQKALRTIPGKLSATERKQFDNLGMLADRAASKGLSASEAGALKNGITTLLARHPQAAKRYHLDQVNAGVSASGATDNSAKPTQASLPIRPADAPTAAAPTPSRDRPHPVSPPDVKRAVAPPAAPIAKPDKPHHAPVAHAPNPQRPVKPDVATRAPVTAPNAAPHRRVPETARPPVAPKPVATARPAPAPKVTAPTPPKPVIPAPTVTPPRR